jgi:ribose 5-phosphate isomerase A
MKANGNCKLPVEVLPFGSKATLHQIVKAGYHGEFRKKKEGALFMTDNGNLIVDIQLGKNRNPPEEDHATLRSIPGILETGFFFNLAGRVIIGYADGQVVIKP